MAHMLTSSRCRLAAVAFATALAGPAFAAESPAKHPDHKHDAAFTEIRDQVASKWLVVPGLDGADQVRVRVRLKLDQSGRILGQPDVTASGGPVATRTALANSAYRAVVNAAPFKNLPLDKYADWKEVTMHFEAGDLGL
jgi:hypothetical protein